MQSQSLEIGRCEFLFKHADNSVRLWDQEDLGKCDSTKEQQQQKALVSDAKEIQIYEMPDKVLK